MPRDITTTSQPVFPAPLAGWIEDILEGGHPDVPWKPPARLPTQSDLRKAIAGLEAALNRRTDPAFAKQCLAKLMVAFEINTKLTAEETRLRAAVWLEANGDMSEALWSEATTAAIRGLKWMPKPAEFRDLVAEKILRMRRQLDRLNQMLDAHRRTDKPFVPEPEDVRMQAAADTFRRLGNVAKAEEYEARAEAARRPKPVSQSVQDGEIPF